MKSPEIPNIITVLASGPLKDTHLAHLLEQWENQIFAFAIVFLVTLLILMFARKPLTMVPSRKQGLFELFMEKFRGMVYGILGPKYGKEYLPFVASLFTFILINNLFALVPFMKAVTSSYKTTLGLALVTFFYVQYTGIRRSGLAGYLYHLIGSPKSKAEFAMIPLLAPLHIIGELAKPLSLSLRLFGNIMGEDILLGVFVGFGIALWGLTGLTDIPMAVPLHLPFCFLALLTSVIQALVFSLLTTIYLSLVLPHDEH